MPPEEPDEQEGEMCLVYVHVCEAESLCMFNCLDMSAYVFVFAYVHLNTCLSACVSRGDH